MYQVIKRDGQIAEFDIKKIAVAITKAFDAVQKQYHPSIIDMLALKVTADFEPKIKDGKVAGMGAAGEILHRDFLRSVYDMDVAEYMLEALKKWEKVP